MTFLAQNLDKSCCLILLVHLHTTNREAMHCTQSTGLGLNVVTWYTSLQSFERHESCFYFLLSIFWAKQHAKNMQPSCVTQTHFVDIRQTPPFSNTPTTAACRLVFNTDSFEKTNIFHLINFSRFSYPSNQYGSLQVGNHLNSGAKFVLTETSTRLVKSIS